MESSRPALGGEPASQTLSGVEAYRFDDRSRQPPMGRDAIFLSIRVGQEQRHARGPHELADRVEEHLERAGQIESRGERAREFLEDAGERGALPRLVRADRRARRLGPETGAQCRDLARQVELVDHPSQHTVQLALRERHGQGEVGGLAVLGRHTDGDGEGRRRDRPHPRDERLDVAGSARAADDHVDLDEPQRLQRLGVVGSREDGMLAEGDHETRPQRVVGRDDQDRVHADTGMVAVTATGKSTVKTAPPASRLVALMRAPWV